MATTASPNNPASVSDLVDRNYPVSDDIATWKVVETRLDEAWRALVLEVPSIPTRIADGSLDKKTVADVVAGAALRVLRNPEGFNRGAGTIDDYREEWEVANSTEDLYFTRAELRRLAPRDYGAGSMAYTR